MTTVSRYCSGGLSRVCTRLWRTGCVRRAFRGNRSPGHSELMKESNHTIDKKVQKLLALLLGIYQKGVVKEVILGYEPADDDMMILRVARKQIEMLNENVFNSRWACSVYNFAKHMKL